MANASAQAGPRLERPAPRSENTRSLSSSETLASGVSARSTSIRMPPAAAMSGAWKVSLLGPISIAGGD